MHFKQINAHACACVCRNWHWDEPSCGYEVCVVMYHQPSAPPSMGGLYMFQWNDDNCDTKNNFICKYTAGPLTQRSSTHHKSLCSPLTSTVFIHRNAGRPVASSRL